MDSKMTKIKKDKIVRVSLDPVNYDPNFDVVRQLREFRSMYMGDTNIYMTLYKVPSHVSFELDRMRALAQVEGGSVIGVNPAIICCLHNGLGILRDLSEITRLRDIRRRILLSSAEEDPDSLLAVHNLMRSKITFPVRSEMQFAPKRSVNMPQKLLIELNDFRDTIGSDQSTVCILSLMATMQSQPGVFKKYRGYFSEAVESFLSSLKVRVKLIERML